MPFQIGAQEWRKVTKLRCLGHHHEGQDNQTGPMKHSRILECEDEGDGHHQQEAQRHRAGKR